MRKYVEFSAPGQVNSLFRLTAGEVLFFEVKNERTHTKTVAPLKEGQVWSLKDKVLEVKRVGKYLVEFLITPKDSKAIGQDRLRVGKHLESIQAVQTFLQTHKAILEGAGS